MCTCFYKCEYTHVSQYGIASVNNWSLLYYLRPMGKPNEICVVSIALLIRIYILGEFIEAWRTFMTCIACTTIAQWFSKEQNWIDQYSTIKIDYQQT